MPTPVSAARQCLTEEAARALDDAVAVARRRSHAQTTSLHAVSALLALPSSTLREACTRARSCSYSPRLQFRALELSVGVSLDRLPTSKALEDDPPIANSLMAAIKRSQANQRRHPESFHLLQMQTQQQQQQAASFLKVELKHFILSILDDPIVSRVFGEAGFRSCDIKLALLQPPFSQASRFSRSRYPPPMFLCNLTGNSEMLRPSFNFPFVSNHGHEEADENCRRIAEVLVRTTQRNPLLVGVYAKGVLRSFTETVQRGRVGGGTTLPVEIAEINVICIEKEIAEFFVEGGSEEKMGLKLEDLSRAVEQCSGPGIAVNFGELEAFVGDAVPCAAVNFVVSQLKSLLEIHGGKLWLVGTAGNSDIYSKFLASFPNVEKDWDLHLLTMTSASPSIEGLYSKSSLMGSFVPFGGFFAAPSEFKKPVGSTTSASSNSTSLPWLQQVNVDANRRLDVAKEEFSVLTHKSKLLVCSNNAYLPTLVELKRKIHGLRSEGEVGNNVLPHPVQTSEELTSLNTTTILGLQKKWGDICQRLHHTRSLPEFNISHTRPQVPSHEGLPFSLGFKESRSKDAINAMQYSSHSPYTPKGLNSICPSKQMLQVSVPSDTICLNTGTDREAIVSKSQQIDVVNPRVAPSPVADTSPVNHRSSSSLTYVATDLGLGTIYTSAAAQEPKTPKVRDHRESLQHLSDSISADFDAVNENNSHQIAQSSVCSGPSLGGKLDSVDFKSLNQLLNERVGWQDEAIYAVNRTLSLCRSGAGKHSGLHPRADKWLAFLGPDRVGKKKIASTLAEIILGNTESLICVDLSFQERGYPLNSIFECQKPFCYDVLRRKTVVDYIAGELSKQPHSVVLLEDVDKADFLVQNSLFQAIRTGKFPNSHGREISINNAVFIVTSTVSKGDVSCQLEKEPMFSEETILEAKRCQMQLLLGHSPEDATRSSGTNIRVVKPTKGTIKPIIPNKRKLSERSDSVEQATTCKVQVLEASRSYLDLNMPVQEVEEDWLDDFCGQIDGKVAFKPFDFDALAEKILKSISLQFGRIFGPGVMLEIDYEVMVQILAAAWLCENKNLVEDWVENVLGRSFNEALKKYHPEAQDFMKLVTCEGIFVEEQAPGACLPAKINLN
ncbi:protein SMAX1-LIKE 7 [Senna tora]|uniref:Protein SMAX1-LIKE 7 n=1 Tax=Senna tora TaxID=362788 RepID=A0A834WGD9_9FABA|nr:protein SMAX1-LIKE 7 [Senna tora]